MSDDTTKLLPTHDAGEDGTTVMPRTSADDHADDGTEVLPTITPAVPADTEVMSPAIDVKSQTAEDMQATQALKQIPSDLDDFAETRDDAEPAGASEPTDAAELSGIAESSVTAVPADTAEPADIAGPEPSPVLDKPLMDMFAGDSVPKADDAQASPVPPLGAAPIPGPAPAPQPQPAPQHQPQAAPQPQHQPAAPQGEAPKGASIPTVVLGLLGVLIGAAGLFLGIELDRVGDWLVALSPQTAIAILCAGCGAILLIVALVWGIVKAVSKPRETAEPHEA